MDSRDPGFDHPIQEHQPSSGLIPDLGKESPEINMAAAMAAEAGAVRHMLHEGLQMPEAPVGVAPAEFGQLTGKEESPRRGTNIDLLLDVSLPVSIELGRTRMTIAEILELGSGSIVELDRLAGEPVDILVNNKPLAKGEVVVVDENFGVRITSLVSPRERLEQLKA
jgi:flagellar motor switch protein FliN